MAISAVQRQQDWGVQYLDESGQWIQADAASGVGAAANDETGAPLAGGWLDSSSSQTAIVASTLAAFATSAGGLSPSLGAAMGLAAIESEPETPTVSIDPPPQRSTALSVTPAAERAAPAPAPVAIAPAPVAIAAPAAVTVAAPAATSSPITRTAAEWSAIGTAWSTNQADFYRLYQQMDEHGWTAADIAHVSGMTEQQVGDYLTRGGAHAGFGGSVTVGQDAASSSYLAALAAAEAGASSQPDGTRPGWSLTTGQALDESGQLVDVTSMAFSRAAFTSWYQSQATPEAQAFARILGTFTTDADGALHFSSGAVLAAPSLTEAGEVNAPALNWGSDGRIAAYDSYDKGNALTIGAMQMQVDTPQTQQIVQVFGGGTPIALPNNEMGERMRAMYGTELATQMLQLTAATDAMKARYLGDLNAALGTPGGPGWTAAPQGAPEVTQYDENGQAVAVGPQYSFDINAYQAWYASQPDAAHQLIGQVYGNGAAGDAASGFRTIGAADSLNIRIGTAEDGNPGVATDATLSSDLVRVDLADPPDLYDNAGVYFLPTQGFVTSSANIKPETDWLDQLLPIIVIAVVSYFSAGTLGPAAAGAMGLTETTIAAGVATTTLTTTGVIVSAAVAGAATSMVSGMLNDNLSLKGILQGALAGALTAGLLKGVTELTGVSTTGTSIPSLVARGTVQGAVQALMGGNFKDGLLAGLASGVASALSANITGSITDGITQGLANGTMTAAEAVTAKYFASMLGTAIKIVAQGSAAPGYAFAQSFLDDALVQVFGQPSNVISVTPVEPTADSRLVGTTGQSFPPVAGDGSQAVASVAAPPPVPEVAPVPAPASSGSDNPASAYDYRNGSDIESDNNTARRDAMYGLNTNGVRLGGGNAATSSTPTPTSYSVSKGESYASIARDYYGDERMAGFIMAANGVSPTYANVHGLQVGANLTLPYIGDMADRDLSGLLEAGGRLISNDQRVSDQLAFAKAQAAEAKQRAGWDALQAGAWSGKTGTGSPVLHAGGSSSISTTTVSDDRYQWALTAAGYEGDIIADVQAGKATMVDAAKTPLGGAMAGTAASFAKAGYGALKVASDTFNQVLDIGTGGIFHNTSLMQQSWANNTALGNGIVNAVTSPVMTTTNLMESVANRYNAAMSITDNDFERSYQVANLVTDVGQGAVGLGSGVRGLARLGASELQGLGVQDSTFKLGSPYTLNANGIGLGLEKLGGAGSDGIPLTSGGAANAATGAALREDLARQAGIPRTLDNVWGANLDDLKASYEMDGWAVSDKAPRASSSGNAQVFTVDAPSNGSVVVKQVQFSPASDASIHGGQYYKFSYTDGSTVKVIDPSTYRVTGWPEANTTFYNQAGVRIVYDPASKTWTPQ